MTITDPTTLKTYFESGDRPTEAQFGHLIDSAVRSAMTMLADALENDGLTGILYIKSAVSATTVANGTYGLRLLAADTTLAVATQITTELNLVAAATGANDYVVSVSNGNYECRLLNTRSISVTAQAAGQVLICAHASAWAAATCSTAGDALISNGALTAPSFEPVTKVTAITSISGVSQIVVNDVPSWANTIVLAVRNVEATTLANFYMVLGNAGAYVSAGYSGRTIDIGDAAHIADGNYWWAVNDSANATHIGTIRLERISGNIWSIDSQMQTTSGSNAIGTCVVDTSTQLTRLYLSPTAGAFNQGSLLVRYRR